LRIDLVVTFAAAIVPRPEVQTPARAEIWIEISAPCAMHKQVTSSFCLFQLILTVLLTLE